MWGKLWQQGTFILGICSASRLVVFIPPSICCHEEWMMTDDIKCEGFCHLSCIQFLFNESQFGSDKHAMNHEWWGNRCVYNREGSDQKINGTWPVSGEWFLSLFPGLSRGSSQDHSMTLCPAANFLDFHAHLELQPAMLQGWHLKPRLSSFQHCTLMQAEASGLIRSVHSLLVCSVCWKIWDEFIID